MRILIVEDEPTLGKQLKSTLEGAGYAVDLSVDGEDGHYMGSTENYDAIIEAICQAWNNLIEIPDTIKSIGKREWAHVGRSQSPLV